MTPSLAKKMLLFGILIAGAAFALAFQSAHVRLPAVQEGTVSFVGSPASGPDIVPNQVLAKFRREVSLPLRAATLIAYKSKVVARIARLDVDVLEIPDGTSVEEMVGALSRNPDIEYAEPNPIVRALVTPNDSLFQYQYALFNTGQLIGSVPGSPQGKSSSDIKAPAGWEETLGKESVTVAVVDTGVDLTHPDLKNKLKTSGRDFVNNDYDASDDFGHGTMVAGIIGAETNNNEGIAGVGWNCKILPVKVLDHTGTGTTDKSAQGIIWAADNGAQVINLSLGGPAGSETLRAALQYAYDKGVVIVAAAGNTGGAVLYPAAYDNYVFAVAATDYNDARASFSSVGAEIDAAAPGVRILTTVPVGYFGAGSLPYGYGEGTSLASPHVAGLAALLKSIKSALKPAEIMDIIRYSADDVNAGQYKGKDEFLGYGRINMEKALIPLKVIRI